MARRKDDDLQEEQPEQEQENEEGTLSRSEKIAYEKELVREGKILPRYSPRNPLGRLVALVLIFFFGIFAAIGGIIGTFAYLGTRPVKEGFNLFNLPYDQYLTENAANKSVLDIVQDVGNFENFSTLGAVSEYTPLVDTLLTQLDEQLGAIGVHLDHDGLCATPFAEIGAYFSENVLKGVVLGEVLGLTPESNQMLVAICYGIEDEDYSVGEGNAFVMKDGKEAMTLGAMVDSDMSTLLDRVTVEGALGISAESDAAMRYLAYGSEGVHYTIVEEDGSKSVRMLRNAATGEDYKKKTIGSLTAADADLLGGARIKDLITIEEDASGILGAVRDWKIDDLGNSKRIERIRLSQIIDTSSATGLVAQIADWRIGDLFEGNKFDTLLFSDLLTINGDSPVILQTLKDVPLGNCSDAIDSMHLAQILGDGIASNKLLSKLQSSTLSSLSKDIEKFSVVDLFGDEIYSFIKYTDPADAVGVEGENTKTYAQIIQEYEQKLKAADDSTQAKELEDPLVALIVKADSKNNESINQYQYKEGKKLSLGVFAVSGTGEQPVYTLVSGNPTVYHVKDDAGNITRLYVEREVRLLPVYEWSIVDYGKKTPSTPAEPDPDEPLPDAQSDGAIEVSTERDDRTLGSPERPADTAACEDGNPLYLLETECYYPVYEDDFGYYYYDTTGERVDLDYKIIGYKTTAEGETLLLNDGKVTYNGEAYFVRSRKATTGEGGEPAQEDYDYLVEKVSVVERYYDSDVVDYNADTLYTLEQTQTRWYLEKEGADGVRLDRFLDGVWYLLFGGEVRDGEGNLVLDGDGNVQVIDSSNRELFKVAENITGVTDVLNAAPLWKLYLHGIVNANPFKKITLPGKDPVNLHDMTITKCIQFLAGLSTT